ncbi:unnamed protein product [Caretta caretta]
MPSLRSPTGERGFIQRKSALSLAWGLFCIGTGDIEDFPGLDSLPKFQVKIEKEKVYIRASKQALLTQRRTKVMAKCISLSNYNISSTNVLIIGAGAAGLVCAETLRQEGFSDRINVHNGQTLTL